MTTPCGLDFGTSNSAIGVIRDGRPVLAELEGGAALFPSAIFFDFERNRPVFGAEAIETYMAQVDGRLMRALKSILATPLVKESTFLKTQRVSFETIIGLFVSEMKARAEASLGRPIDSVVHGRPVHFVDDDEAGDKYAEDTLTVIAQKCGFRHVSFQFEPLAAARAYEAKIEAETLALICDIGGGTSDFSVIRLGPERRAMTDRRGDILANFGIRLGGTDLDRHLSLDAAMPVLGLGTNLKTKNLPMPRQLFTDLAHWPSINNLYTPANRRIVNELHADAVEPEKTARLKALVDGHLGHRLAFAVEATKIALSATSEASIDMDFIQPGLSAPADRDRFDDAVAGERARMAAAVRETLKRAGIAPHDVGTVFLTGGSSRVPALKKAIASVVSPNKFASGDDMLSVALGLTEEARLRYA
jgi:hypothetical chaperone protein